MCLRLFLTVISLLVSASFAAAAPFAYVANSGRNTVSVIDMATNAVVGSEINLGAYNPYAVAVGRSGQYVYVSSQGNAANPQKEITIIDAATRAIKRIALTYQPGGLAVNPAETRLYVANYDSNTLSVWDIASNSEVARLTLTTSSANAAPEGVVVNAAGDTLYVANSGTDSNSVTVISIDEASEPAVYTKVAEIPVGPSPMGLSLDETSKKLYVANFWNGSVSVIDTTNNTKVGTDTTLGGNTPALAASATKLYVSNSNNDITQVLKTDLSKSLFASAPWPWGISYDSVTNKVIAALYQTGAGQVGIYDGTSGTSLATINLPSPGAEPKSMGNFVGPNLPYTITASATNCTINPPAGSVLANGFGRTFTITPNSGYHVDVVTVGGVSVGAPLTYPVIPTGNTTINATCSNVGGTYYTLTLGNPGVLGTVTSPLSLAPKGGAAQFVANASVPITVQPAAGYKVASWTGCDSYSGNTCTVSMTADRTVGVTFEVSLSGPVKVMPNGAYYANIYTACTDTGTQNYYDILLTSALASNENLVTNFGKIMLNLHGGYADETFSSQTGYTRIGSLVVGDTGVTIDRIVIQ